MPVLPNNSKSTRTTNSVEKSITKIGQKINVGKAIFDTASQQVKTDKTTNIISPAIGFDVLLMMYENSYIVGGIADKVARTASSGVELGSDDTEGADNKKEGS